MKTPDGHQLPQPLHLLQVGPVTVREFQPVLDWVADMARQGVVVERVVLSGLADRLGGEPCELVVVCQSAPDEWTVADVERLLSRWPLARVVCCYGPWCESEGRTRTVWPLALWTPVVLAASRLDRELRVISGEVAPLPATATREEAFAWNYLEEIPSQTPGRDEVVSSEWIIVTADRAYGDSLRELISSWPGVRGVTHRTPAERTPVEPLSSIPRLVLWDADPLPVGDGDLSECIASLRETLRAEGVIALVGYPRAEDVARLTEAGAVAVLPKLASAATLWGCLAHCLSTRPTVTA